jgi:hypothetical protein
MFPVIQIVFSCQTNKLIHTTSKKTTQSVQSKNLYKNSIEFKVNRI